MIEYESHPERYTGKGTVYLAFDDERYHGYWELEPDGPPTPLELFPGSPSLSDALEWGRARTPRVLVRPEWDPATYYWAGVGDRPDGWDHVPVLEAR